jgi:hypothetical protein
MKTKQPRRRNSQGCQLSSALIVSDRCVLCQKIGARGTRRARNINEALDHMFPVRVKTVASGKREFDSVFAFLASLTSHLKRIPLAFDRSSEGGSKGILIEVDKAQADLHLLNLILLIFTILLIIQPIVSLTGRLQDL